MVDQGGIVRDKAIIRLLGLVVLTCGYAAVYLAVVAIVYGVARLAGLA